MWGPRSQLEEARHGPIRQLLEHEADILMEE